MKAGNRLTSLTSVKFKLEKALGVRPRSPARSGRPRSYSRRSSRPMRCFSAATRRTAGACRGIARRDRAWGIAPGGSRQAAGFPAEASAMSSMAV
ncbi:hypothetical protein [Azospirillum palustre]